MAPLMFHESTTMFNECMLPADLSLDMNGLFDDDDDFDASKKQLMISGEHSTIISPQGSSSSSSYYTPKGGVIGNNKAAFKRRSRACKKGKTTLLKANAKDFRALVQRLTGCSRADDDDHRLFKGPINLDFSKHNRSVVKSSSALQHQRKLRSRIDDVHEEEGSDQRFLSFAYENSVTSAADATNRNPCDVSSMVLGNPKPDHLSSLDDLPDMENFFLPLFSDPDEDCSDLLVDNEFWAY